MFIFSAVVHFCFLSACSQTEKEDSGHEESLDIEETEGEADVDGDGVRAEDGDCDDSDPDINPNEDEIWYDGVDQNCDGRSDYDQDGDGEDATEYGGSDCNDIDPTILSTAEDVWYDGIDQNCDGRSDYDQDGDGDDATEYGGGDCHDTDPTILSETDEIWYDGIDQNCDGLNDYDQDGDGMDDRMVDLSNTPRFVMELHPIGNNVGNVLQGLAVDVEREELWMSVDTSFVYENVLINRLSLLSGNSQYCEEYTESNNIGLGHGQDLSLEYDSNGDPLLWIGSESDMGVTRVDPKTMTIDVLSQVLPTGWSHVTPTLGLQHQWLAVRGSKDGDEANNDWIRIYDKSDIESGFSSGQSPIPLYEFNIAPAQRVDDMWFQGLALDEEAGLVYAITGNNTLSQSEKLLYVYDLEGNVLNTTTIGMDWSTANAMGSKYEPEGLSLVKDPDSHVRYLYFSMMFGSSGRNIKRLYAIAPSSISAGGTYSNNEIDWLIRYNSSSGAVSVSTATENGTTGCETKRTTWSNNWSSFVGYYVDGDPYLFLQKEVGGTAKIHPLDWDATFNSATKDSNWSDGWSNLHAWEHAGSTYLLHYKSGSTYSGLMRTLELTNDGDTDCCLEDEYWATGWLTHVYTVPNGDDYLLRYLPSTQNVRLSPLTSGYIGSDVYNSTWTGTYRMFGSVQKGASGYVVALTDTGVVESFAVQSNGLLVASDSLNSTVSNWTSFLSYSLEGQAIVHLYRSSDGFYTLYELDNNGAFQGPIASGFEEVGWSSIHHFRTTP
ncbi:MAG: putative metal-binding motif-containing protein [Myxococcota bacterium]|nr:putative metal-binding motif-containing protein [Myxococcota bacterium]